MEGSSDPLKDTTYNILVTVSGSFLDRDYIQFMYEVGKEETPTERCSIDGGYFHVLLGLPEIQTIIVIV